MKRGLGEMERLLLAYVQWRGQPTVRAGEMVGPLQLSAARERNLLSRLAKAGLIARVWRGLYLVPPRLPLGGKWSPSEVLALNTLMEDQGGHYQMCGLEARRTSRRRKVCTPCIRRGAGRWWTRCMIGRGSTACRGPMHGPGV